MLTEKLLEDYKKANPKKYAKKFGNLSVEEILKGKRVTDKPAEVAPEFKELNPAEIKENAIVKPVKKEVVKPAKKAK